MLLSPMMIIIVVVLWSCVNVDRFLVRVRFAAVSRVARLRPCHVARGPSAQALRRSRRGPRPGSLASCPRCRRYERPHTCPDLGNYRGSVAETSVMVGVSGAEECRLMPSLPAVAPFSESGQVSWERPLMVLRGGPAAPSSARERRLMSLKTVVGLADRVRTRRPIAVMVLVGRAEVFRERRPTVVVVVVGPAEVFRERRRIRLMFVLPRECRLITVMCRVDLDIPLRAHITGRPPGPPATRGRRDRAAPSGPRPRGPRPARASTRAAAGRSAR